MRSRPTDVIESADALADLVYVYEWRSKIHG